ncbi:hypothetical protein [Nostoc sp. CCY0012]|uniref:hypothetical protein n=1 Tax=Nostoc sp. CCY0012 TaxID=1056123 RepID=UPI0039C61AAB
MGRVVEFNAANWQLLMNYSANAVILGEFTYVPLQPIESPTFLENNIIAVYISTTIPNGRRWNFGGTVEQRFISGLTVGGSTDAAGITRRMSLNKITTILFPKISASYSLKFYFPSWFKDVQLQCWEYTGIDDTDEQILLAEEFENINFKLNQLLNNT